MRGINIADLLAQQVELLGAHFRRVGGKAGCLCLVVMVSSLLSTARHGGDDLRGDLHPLAHDRTAEQFHRIEQRSERCEPEQATESGATTAFSFLPIRSRAGAQLRLDRFLVPFQNLFEIRLDGVQDFEHLLGRGLHPGKGGGLQAEIRLEEEGGEIRQFAELRNAGLRELQTFP